MAKSKGGLRGTRPTNSRPVGQRGGRSSAPSPTFGIGAGIAGGSGMNEPRKLPRLVRTPNNVPLYERGRTAYPRRSIEEAKAVLGRKISGAAPLRDIKDPQVYKEVKKAISRFYATFGIREKQIFLANKRKGYVLGTHWSFEDGTSIAITLNKDVFNKSKKEIEKIIKDNYNSGHLTKTNKPIADTITHELAHALWGQEIIGRKPGADREIQELYDSWNALGQANRRKSGYGRYAERNIDEFWAETVKKAVHGESDYYTTRVKEIIKKYSL